MLKMKTIEKLQRLAGLGKIVSRIFLFISIFLIILSIIMLMVVILSGSTSLDVKGLTVGTLLKDRSSIETLDVMIYIIALVLYFIGHTFLWNSAYRYFAVEIESGTPFRNENYRNLRSLGIATIAFPSFFELMTVVLINFASEHVFSGSSIMEYNPFSTLSLGIMIIFVSVVCRYGAEVEAKRNA